jgi:hypothetical protein
MFKFVSQTETPSSNCLVALFVRSVMIFTVTIITVQFKGKLKTSNFLSGRQNRGSATWITI